MSKNMLCVGGPMDGQRISVQHGAEQIVRHDTRGVRYVRRSLAGGKSRFDLLVLDGLTDDDVIARLLDNYVPNL